MCYFSLAAPASARVVATVRPVPGALVGTPRHVALVLRAETRRRRRLTAVEIAQAGFETDAIPHLTSVSATVEMALPAEVIAQSIVAFREVGIAVAGPNGTVNAQGHDAVLDAVGIST